jgi:hypothetical protein
LSTHRPINILNPKDVGVFILPNFPREFSKHLETLRRAEINCFDITDVLQPAWVDPNLIQLMNRLKCRQLLIIATYIGIYEIGLVNMALEKGFNVFFAGANLENNSLNVERVRQASAIMVDIDEITKEMNL